jgi:CRISPR-associated protein (Cas_Cas02710)
MESLKTVLVANLGVTSEPIIKAFETAIGEGNLMLFLAYGKKIQDQEEPPFVMAQQIDEKAKQQGVTCRIYELETPEEFQGAFSFYHGLMEVVSQRQPEKVIIDVTGGTKVMSAALVHAALTQKWGAEVIFEYVGGPRGSTGRVREMELIRDDRTVTDERIKLVLEAVHQQEFSRAVILTDYLPGHGDARFLKEVADIFWKWDNFHYDEVKKPLEDISIQAKTLIGNIRLGKIADTILRLQKESGKIMLAMSALRKLKVKGDVVLTDDILEGWITILGDTIANARRRAESDPLECVLRCYRAIELTTQIGISKLGVNSQKPDWTLLSDDQLTAYKSKIQSNQVPRNISLDLGTKLIETLSSPLPENVHQSIKVIMSSRNQSYLEHGYDRILKKTALGLMTRMENVVPVLLNHVGIKDDPFVIADRLRIEA